MRASTCGGLRAPASLQPVRRVQNPLHATLAWLGALTDRLRWVSPASGALGAIVGAVLLAGVTAVRIALAVVVLGLASLPEVAAAWWRTEEEKANRSAAVEAQVLIRQALTPLADLTGLLAQGAANPSGLFARACQHATASCLLPFKDSQEVRALVFTVSDDTRRMECVARSGRLGDSDGFDRSHARGKSAFKVLLGGMTVHVDDLAKARGEHKRAWLGSGVGYDTFVTVPIVVGDRAYGLLTVDAPTPGTFGRTDILFVELVASMLGALFAERIRRGGA